MNESKVSRQEVVKALRIVGGFLLRHRLDDPKADNVIVLDYNGKITVQLERPDLAGKNGASALGNTIHHAGYTYDGCWEDIAKGGIYTITGRR
jgi:hypothetical protein